MLGYFCVYHIYIIKYNYTTNEKVKYDRYRSFIKTVKQSFKKHLKEIKGIEYNEKLIKDIALSNEDLDLYKDMLFQRNY